MSVDEEGLVLVGLTDAEVADRVGRGLTNANTDVKTKSVRQILAEHTFTLFNGVNFALAIVVFLTGQYRNAAFMGVVLLNLFIGVFQEVRAKQMVDRLTILTAKRVKVLRDGQEHEIAVEEIVRDDVVLLAHGDQIPADGVVLRGSPLVDESLLTGESDSIEKHVGDELYSGSFVVAGDVAYRVTRVGEEGYAAKINAEARYIKPVSSEILKTIRMIIGFAAIVLVPLGAGLFLRTVNMEGATMQGPILSSVAAMVGMIPQGLVLLASGVLAIATMKLGSRGVLVQQSYCIETLARVDTLCLDKTGTITSGKMEVTAVKPCDGVAAGEVERAFATITQATANDANETALALIAYATDKGVETSPVARVIPFSSARKYSGCVTEDGRSLVLGAAQFVLGDGMADYLEAIRSFDELERVLTVAEVPSFDEEGSITGSPRVLGFVALRDEIRPTAEQTINYFHDQGVNLKVISGDDSRTVSAIASSVGIRDADAYVDATTLHTDEEVAEAARTKNVFGRVTPQQKRTIVRTLHGDGHIVAMTGDGVNDVLALKEADCSIAVASGSDVACQVAQIVLMDNNFASMPSVVAEGRRVINNIERSASLYLVKNIFTFFLAFFTLFATLPYPFSPAQLSMVNGVTIGIPSFILAMEPNENRIRGKFLRNVIFRALPCAMTDLVLIVGILLFYIAFRIDDTSMSTICTGVMGIVGLMMVHRTSKPYNKLRIAMIICLTLAFLVAFFFLPEIFTLKALNFQSMLILVVFGLLAWPVLSLFSRLNDRLREELTQLLAKRKAAL